MLPELFPKAVRTTGMSVVYGWASRCSAVSRSSSSPGCTRHPQSDGAWYLMVTVTLSTVVLFWIQDRTGHDIDNQEA